MLLEHRLEESLEEWAGLEAPGQFLALCGAFYVAAHRRSLRDKVPTVPFMLKSERLINPHFDRGLLRHAEVVIAMLEAQTGTRSLGAAAAPAAPETVQEQQLPDQPSAVLASSAESLPQASPSPGLLEGEVPVAADAAAAEDAPDAAEPAAQAEEPPAAEEVEGDAGAAGPAREATTAANNGFFVTGGAAPAYQFAFLYKQDLEALREELQQGLLSGPEAATRLGELERRLFSVPLLTGPADCFCADGVEPWEEDAALSDDGRRSSHPEAVGPAVAPSGQEEPDDAEDRSEEPSWDVRWPSELQVTSALKVLGVLPEVPVGPKAPCADPDLPVSLRRLQTVMRRLHVSEEHLQALREVLMKEDFGASQAASEQCSWCSDQSAFCQGASRRQLLAMNSEEDGDVMPLRQVLQLLRPTPVRERTAVQRCFRRCWRFLRHFWRDCVELVSPPAAHRGEPRAPPSGPQPPEDPLQEKEDEGPDVFDAVGFAAKHRRAVERVFSAHALDKCALCSCAFHARSAAVRRLSSQGSRD